MRRIVLVLVILFFAVPALAQNTKVKNFAEAKTFAAYIHKTIKSRTLYCGCVYEGKKVEWDSCGYVPKGSHKRAGRIEWEHIVPASLFGTKFPSWVEGHKDCVDSKGESYKGRRCATKVSELFNRMASDLHNLFPSVGEINGLRSNKRMGIVAEEKREFGQCDFEIGDGVVEPMPSIRGTVARAYLYMDWAYPGFEMLWYGQRRVFLNWHTQYPPTTTEKLWNVLVGHFQGTLNPFIH